MGLFFIRRKHFKELLETAKRVEDCNMELSNKCRKLEYENKQLREAVKASREAFDKALPVTVVHSWTS